MKRKSYIFNKYLWGAYYLSDSDNIFLCAKEIARAFGNEYRPRKIRLTIYDKKVRGSIKVVRKYEHVSCNSNMVKFGWFKSFNLLPKAASELLKYDKTFWITIEEVSCKTS